MKKNLPAHVGDVLKQALQKAENDAIRVRELTEEQSRLRLRIDELSKIIDKYKECDDRNYLLDSRERKIQEQEINMKIKELEYKLDSEKGKTEFCKSIANGLVRNTDYRSHVFSSKTEYKDDKYGNRTPEIISNDSSQTKTAD